MMAKRVLVCGFHQESNTFNPVTSTMDRFTRGPVKEGKAAYDALTAKDGRVAIIGVAQLVIVANWQDAILVV